MATTEEISAKIAEAEGAYHSLMTGTMARVVVDQNGERVEFVAANASRLYQYIQDLKALLPSASTPISGPLGFYF
jgi:predicted TPR repeat methyltransferase